MSKNYKRYSQANGDPIQVDSAIRDGNGKNIANNYAKQNGFYSGLTSGLAVNIKTNQGATVTDAIAKLDPISVAVEDGDFASMTNFKGRSFAYNQLTKNGNFENKYYWNIIGGGSDTSNISVSNNILTWTKSGSTTGIIQSSFNKITGHKYLCIASVNPSALTAGSFLITGGNKYDSGGYNGSIPANTWTTLVAIVTATATGTGSLYIYGDINAIQSNGFTCQYKKINCFDLTAMGINTTDVSEAIAALKSYGIDPSVYNEYSPGKIIDSQPNKIISRGFNQWDEECELGYYNAQGEKTSGSDGIRSKNQNKTIPNTTYYFYAPSGFGNAYINYYDKNNNFISRDYKDTVGTFTTPANAYYFTFFVWGGTYGTTYNHDICINVSNTALNGTYKPYVANEYTITAPVMRSAGSVADDKDNVKIYSYTFTGNEYWTYSTGSWAGNYFQFVLPIKSKGSAQNVANAMLSNGSKVIARTSMASYNDDCFCIDYDQTSALLQVKNASITDTTTFASYMAGKTINYEMINYQPQNLVLPTNIITYNGGTLETQYTSPNTTPGLVSMLYQVNLKNFIESLGAREDINFQPNEIVSKTEFNGTVEGLENGLKDGSFVVKQSENSMSAQSLDTSIGTDDQAPFNYQTAGGTSDITTGIQKLKKLVGASVVFNQLIDSDTDTEKTENGVTTTLVNGKYTMSGTATDNTFGVVAKRVNLISGHKYLLYIEQTGTEQSGTTWQIYADAIALYAPNTCILNPNYNGEIDFLVAFYANAVINASFYLELFDLTQMFGSQVADYIYAKEQANAGDGVTIFKSLFPKDYYPYNPGTFIHSKSAKLKMVDYNQFDGQWGAITYSSFASSVNYTPVIPNALYKISNTNSQGEEIIDGRRITITEYNFQKEQIQEIEYYASYTPYSYTPSSNCCFIKLFIAVGSLTVERIGNWCVFLYWDGSRIGYEPYQEHIYDLPNDELKGILKVVDNKIVADGDEEYPDGTKKVKYGLKNLSELTWSGSSGGFIASYSDVVFPSVSYVEPDILCPIYDTIEPLEQYQGSKIGITTNSNGVGSQGGFRIYDPSCETVEQLLTKINGVYVLYLLATETETTSTAFAENIYVDDFGTMEFLDENNVRITGIQGNEIFYKANISGFAESLYVKTDGDIDDLVTQEDIATYNMANIVDSNGNRRFIEINPIYSTVTGVTHLYAKASLSGTHFMIVDSIKVDANTSISVDTIAISYRLPQWILNKVVPMGSSTRVNIKNFDIFNVAGQIVDAKKFSLIKDTLGVILFSAEAFTFTSDVYIRVQFDLLIDNS